MHFAGNLQVQNTRDDTKKFVQNVESIMLSTIHRLTQKLYGSKIEAKYGVSIFLHNFYVCVSRDFEISKFVFIFFNWAIYFFSIINQKKYSRKRVRFNSFFDNAFIAN